MIYKAKLKDLISINELGKDFYSNFRNLYKLEEYLKNENYIILVNKDKIINGFLIIYKNIEYYELELIVVDKNYRKQGIANSLINHFIENYTSKEDVILLEVAVNNEPAINLYKKFKFDIINIRKNYYNTIDAYVMKKVI